MIILKVYMVIGLAVGSFTTVAFYNRWLEKEKSERMCELIDEWPDVAVPACVIIFAFIWPLVLFAIVRDLIDKVLGASK